MPQWRRNGLDGPASFSPDFFVICLEQVSQAARRLASAGLFRPAKRHCCPPPSVIDAGRHRYPTIIAGPRGLELNKRIGPRHRRLAEGGFRFARWLGAKTMGAAGFHQLGSDFADARIARVREKLARGETVYLAGLGPPGTHNSGVALVEVPQADGPRLIVNNEEERFSGNKHTTEYPRQSIEAMVATLRGMGRDIGDVDAWLT